jgi:multiple sugar transport system ATP-binding protein
LMKDGLIQQIGTPLEVYGSPTNKFVAGFIGAPSMNFLDVMIRTDGAALVAEAPGMRLEVPAAIDRAISGWRDKRVTLGVRPEHLSLGNGVPRCSFDASVEVLEQLGSEIVLEARAGDARLMVARINPQASLRIGDRLRLSVEAERLHFFDPATEKAIR